MFVHRRMADFFSEGIDLMHYIVFDLEWNIAGRANRVSAEDLKALPFEIIEIGAVKLDESFNMISKFNVTVKPKLYPILSGHVAAVTRRIQQSLKFGISFVDAARDFLKWCGDDFMFCTWSESDTGVLKQNLAYYGFPDKLNALCLDVQYLFDQVIEKAGIQRSVEYALDFLSIDKSRPFHQAVQDAWYTGDILRAIVELINNDATADGSKINIVDYAYDPDLNRSYQQTLEVQESVAHLLQHLLSVKLVCPACGKDLERVDGWSRKGNRMNASFVCPEHGSVSGRTKMRIRPREAKENVSAYLTVKLDRNKPLIEA